MGIRVEIPRCLDKAEAMDKQKKDDFVARCELAESKKYNKAKRLAIETRARVATGEYTASWQGESASVKVVGAPPAPTEAPLPQTHSTLPPAPRPNSRKARSEGFAFATRRERTRKERSSPWECRHRRRQTKYHKGMSPSPSGAPPGLLPSLNPAKAPWVVTGRPVHRG